MALALIVLVTFFTGAYAIAEAAVNGEPSATPNQALLAPNHGYETSAEGSSQLDWYESAAIWVCPLH